MSDTERYADIGRAYQVAAEAQKKFNGLDKLRREMMNQLKLLSKFDLDTVVLDESGKLVTSTATSQLVPLAPFPSRDELQKLLIELQKADEERYTAKRKLDDLTG